MEAAALMKAEKRGKIMKAAEALFAGGGFHEITMDDVAAKAGVGKGTLYRYFEDKEELFFEVALSGYDELCEMIRTERDRTGSFGACLIGVCGRISEFHWRRRRLIHMMQAEERRALWRRGKGSEQWLRKKGQLVGAVRSMLEAGRREGCIREDLDLDVLAVFLLALLRTRGWGRSGRGGGTIDHDTVVDVFLNGVGKGGA